MLAIIACTPDKDNPLDTDFDDTTQPRYRHSLIQPGLETYDPVDTRSFARFDDSLTLIHEIDLTSTAPDWTYPAEGTSEIQMLLGSEARVLPPGNEWSAMSYTLGAGLSLEAGKDYLLEFSYPDDLSRSMFVINRGAETMRGFHTGTALGDALGGYTNPNPESYPYHKAVRIGLATVLYPRPLSRCRRLGRTQLPEDGIDIVIVSLSDPNPLIVFSEPLAAVQVTGDAVLPLYAAQRFAPSTYIS